MLLLDRIGACGLHTHTDTKCRRIQQLTAIVASAFVWQNVVTVALLVRCTNGCAAIQGHAQDVLLSGHYINEWKQLRARSL